LCSLLGHEVLDEASAGDDARPEPPRAVRIHIGPLSPPVVGCGQPETNLVLEDVGRRIELDVHGPPERDPHRRSLRCLYVFVFVSHARQPFLTVASNGRDTAQRHAPRHRSGPRPDRDARTTKAPSGTG
jgi:hypothetical protein